MRAATLLHRIGACAAFLLLGVPTAQRADAQAWDAVKYFQYNIENVTVAPDPVVLGGYTVRVMFSVTDPTNAGPRGTSSRPRRSVRGQGPGDGSEHQREAHLDIGWDPLPTSPIPAARTRP